MCTICFDIDLHITTNSLCCLYLCVLNGSYFIHFKIFYWKKPHKSQPFLWNSNTHTRRDSHKHTHTHTQILYLNTPGTDIYLQNDKMISGPSGPMFTPIQQNHILPVMLFPDPFPFKQQRWKPEIIMNFTSNKMIF